MAGGEPGREVRRSVQERANEVMGREVPMSGATIFELGGDSLTAARIASDVGRDVGVEVPVDLLFDADDLDDLAARLERRLDSNGTDGT
jgi:hypothetical protein